MSRSARRLPPASAVDRVVWPAPAGADAVPRLLSIAVDAGRGQRQVAVREPYMPPSVADRIAAAEREAFARGLAEGERSGGAAANARLDAMVARMARAIDEISTLRPSLLQRSEQELVRAAIAMAEHILRRAVEADPTHLLTMARAAIERLGATAAAAIHLNPAEFAAIQATQPDALTRGAVQVVADPDVPPGGCLARSTHGEIDLGIDSQVRELTRGLLGEKPPAAGDPSTDANAGG
jgi:flagellar biosynthesis/type III secretory pathway protein FliH